MKPTLRKILGAALSAAMLLTAFSACKKEGGDVNNAGNFNASGIVYRAKRYTVSGVASDDTSGYVVRDGRLYFLTAKPSGNIDPDTGYYDQCFCELNSTKLDGSDLQTVPLNSGETYINSFDFDSEGNIVYVESPLQENVQNENDDALINYMLKKIKTDGTSVSETDITSAINDHKVNYFSSESIAVAPNGNIIVNGYYQLILLDGDGNYLFDIKWDEGIRRLVKSASGEVYVSAYGEESYSEFYKIDMEKKSFGENIDIVQGYDFDYDIVPYNGRDDVDIYVEDSNSLYSFDLESGVKTEIFNFVNSDVSKQEISELIPAGEDGSFIGIGQSYPAKNMLITAIYPVDASTLPPKTEILVAGSIYSINSMLEYQAVKFNMENDKYRIVIKKYTTENYITKLNSDITSGNIPDILITDNSVPFESYAAKGIFTDLYEFIDKDDTINREDFLPNLMTAMEIDGKLYRFTDSFKISTAIGKTSIFGKETGIDFKRINEIMQARPEGTEIFAGTTKENILEHAMELCGDNFIDYKTGKCDFTSDYFIELLEFANGFLNSVDLDGYFNDAFWDRYRTMYANEETLMLITYITDFSDIFYNEHEIFGEKVTSVGFPTFSGLGAAFDVSGGFAISAKSKNQDGAWEFVRSLLTEDYQDSVGELPVRKASLEKKAQRNMKEFDPQSTRITIIGSMALGTSGYNIEDSKPTQADIDKTMEIITSTTQINRYNYTVTNIVTEEAGAYFSGSKSAEDVAQMIQNRVQNYLYENQ
ncbi:MAG: extracellular solute-binding protein [Oscillospiraceae bacterium]|nr:extracellular solute-binding protein [Oscillospiraceae bacterium]